MSAQIFTRTDVSLLSDKGCVRATNEDAASVFSSNDPDLLEQKGKLIVVADGMGGHLGGEVASNLAIRTIGRVYYDSRQQAADSLKSAFEEANRLIYEAAIADQQLAGMGTTCTALVVCGNSAFSAHV